MLSGAATNTLAGGASMHWKKRIVNTKAPTEDSGSDDGEMHIEDDSDDSHALDEVLCSAGRL